MRVALHLALVLTAKAVGVLHRKAINGVAVERSVEVCGVRAYTATNTWGLEGGDVTGCRLWPSGIEAALAIGDMGDLRGVSVLEVGSGPGVATIVAARRGASCLSTDVHAMSNELVAAAAADQGLRVRVGLFNLSSPPPLPAADVVVMSDLTYDLALAAAAGDRAREAADRGSRVIAAHNPLRPGCRAFRDKLGPGFTFEPVRVSAIRLHSDASNWKTRLVEVVRFDPP